MTEPALSPAAATAVRRPRLTVRRALALYGLVLGALVVGVGAFAVSPSRFVLMDSRVASLASSVDVLDHGGPPLLASSKPYAEPWRTTPGQSYRSAAYTDDPGLYLYLGEAGHVLGIHDPRRLLQLFTVCSLALVAAVYPLVFFELFASVAAAVASPLLLGTFTFLRNSDIYWVSAWCALLCLPVLALVAARRWGRGSAAVCVGAGLVGSYASSVRSEAGLGVAIAALGLVLLREATWRRRLAVGALVVVAYLAVRPLAIDGVEAYRDHAIAAYVDANPGWRNVSSSGHPFWHAAYLGLGYLPNRWGIAWNDSNAAAYVRRVDPSAPYLSARYASILEHRYLHILRSDPGFVVRTYATKASVEANDALRRFLPGLLVLPVLTLFGRRRRLLGATVLLALPTLAIQFAAPVLTIPGVYGVGFLATVGLLALFAGCALLAEAGEALTGRRGRGSARSALPALRAALRRPRGLAAGGLALLVLVAAVALHSKHAVLRPGSATGGAPAARP